MVDLYLGGFFFKKQEDAVLRLLSIFVMYSEPSDRVVTF
jgi:hypothetical protein